MASANNETCKSIIGATPFMDLEPSAPPLPMAVPFNDEEQKVNQRNRAARLAQDAVNNIEGALAKKFKEERDVLAAELQRVTRRLEDQKCFPSTEPPPAWRKNTNSPISVHVLDPPIHWYAIAKETERQQAIRDAVITGPVSVRRVDGFGNQESDADALSRWPYKIA